MQIRIRGLPESQSAYTNSILANGKPMPTLQESTVSQLKTQIERGDYVLGSRLPPMRELVKIFGVSEITVRAALRELASLGLVERRPRSGVFVSEPTQKRVAGKSDGAKVTLACVMPSLHNSFFAQILSGIEEECTRAGHRLIAISTRGSQEEEARQIHELAREVEGVVVCPMDSDKHGAYLELLDAGIPFVFVDRRLAFIAAPLVSLDDELGGYEATRHLIRAGRKRIWFLSPPFHHLSSVDARLEGFKRALAEADIKFDESLVLQETGVDEAVGYQLTSQLLKHERFEKPIGVVAVNDGIARGAYLAVKEVGRRIPEDVAFVSFGDNVASVLEPPLSSIDQDLPGMGAQAMRLLLQLHGGDKRSRFQHRNRTIKLPVHLTVRSSSDAKSTFCAASQFKRDLLVRPSATLAVLPT